MMAAAQPFLSGAISKTVNLPENATVEDIMQHLRRGLENGPQGDRHLSRRLEALRAAQHDKKTQRQAAARRRGHRRAEIAAARTRASQELEAEVAALRDPGEQPVRRRMPDTRVSLTHKFDIAGHEGYLTVGLFEDGQPGELFITMTKEGSTIGGLMDTIGTLTSHGAAIRRAARSAGQEIRLPALRAERLHQEPRHPQRHLDHRLRLPLAGLPVHQGLQGGHLAAHRASPTCR